MVCFIKSTFVKPIARAMLLAGQLVDLQKEDIKTTRYKNYNKYQLGILISSFWRYRPANALTGD